MNHLLDREILRNRYFAMRHGHSQANEQGIIVSHADNGCGDFGLSELGRLQVSRNLEKNIELGRDTLVVSSDFRRALESAQIALELLACSTPIRIEKRLRERYFGALELSSDRGYETVWREDRKNPDSERGGMESANQVMARVTSLVIELENSYRDAAILLVSHGDALQLLQTAFCKQNACRHRSLEHLETAEIRELALPDSADVIE